MRKIKVINDNWFFSKNIKSVPSSVPTDCEQLNLPYTWNGDDGQDGGNDYYRGKCCFIKELPASEFEGEVNYIEFGAVNSTAEVYWNGEKLCVHHGGYSIFRVELKEIKENNLLVVFADNRPNDFVYPQMADFTFYGGIYRDVKLISVSKNHFELDYYGTPGIKITPVVNGKNAEVTVVCYTKCDKDCAVSVRILSDGVCIAEKEVSSDKAKAVLTIENAHLWNGRKDPYLYTAEAVLTDKGEECDRVSARFGCRSFRVDPDKGFILNGESYPLRGVSRHQDRPHIGNALTYEHHKEDIDLICEVGATTVRLAHYQHSQDFYDLCDERGLVVWAEIPYISQHLKNGTENTLSQMKELIIQNYNHPSIVVWGLSNEITMAGATDKNLIDNHRQLNDLCHELDKTRLTTSAVLSMCSPKEEYTFIPDILSYNHYFGWYGGLASMNGKWFDDFHKKYPDRCVGLSEYGAEGLNWHTSNPEQGDYTEEYQLFYHEELIKQIAKRPYIWATHVWNMFDFAADARSEGGENGMNHKGLVSFDRKYKKDSFYAYKAWLSDEKVIHICSKRYVDRCEDITKVKVCANTPYVELYANGEFVERKEKGEFPFFEFDVRLSGETKIEAKCGDISDESVIRRVDKPNEDYVMKDTNSVINWFEISTPPGYYSINDTVGDILSSFKGKLFLIKTGLSLLRQLKGGSSKDGEKKGEVAGMNLSSVKINKNLIDTAKSFTLKRLFMMAGKTFTKEMILDINADLNKIKKKAK